MLQLFFWCIERPYKENGFTLLQKQLIQYCEKGEKYFVKSRILACAQQC